MISSVLNTLQCTHEYPPEVLNIPRCTATPPPPPVYYTDIMQGVNRLRWTEYEVRDEIDHIMHIKLCKPVLGSGFLVDQCRANK